MEKVVKNMVCPRCVESVTKAANDLRLPVRDVEIGKISFTRKLRSSELENLASKLEENGFELAENRNQEIVSSVQAALIDYLSYIETGDGSSNISSFLTRKLPYNYSYLSQVFSREKGTTIEKFFIKLKIERVKELLEFKKYTLSEIAWKLNYSSVQYLSNQFKSVTGITVTEYLGQPDRERIPLDQL